MILPCSCNEVPGDNPKNQPLVVVPKIGSNKKKNDECLTKTNETKIVTTMNLFTLGLQLHDLSLHALHVHKKVLHRHDKACQVGPCLQSHVPLFAHVQRGK